MPCLLYTSKTCLSIATLDHRIKWNSYKIRTVIMAAIRPEDITIVFRLINELYYDCLLYTSNKVFLVNDCCPSRINQDGSRLHL